MRDQQPASSLPTHPAPLPAPTRTFWHRRGDRQVEEGLVRVHWRRRDPFHHLLGDQALRAPPVPQLRSQKWSAAWERPNPISTGTSPAALSLVIAPRSRRWAGGHILNPHTPHPKPTMFPLHSQRIGGEARFPLRHQARQAHAVDAQGRVQVRSVRLRVRREGEGHPQGYSGGVERQNQTRHFSREDRGVGVQPLRPFYSPS